MTVKRFGSKTRIPRSEGQTYRRYGFRGARWVVLAVAGAITLLAVVVLIAAYRNDGAIDAAKGSANAEVLSVGPARTIVRFESPDGIVHISQDGVLYPGDLWVGQQLLVEYDATNPNLVRVAGRSADLSLLPLGTTVLITWGIAGTLLWWLSRRKSDQPAKPLVKPAAPG